MHILHERLAEEVARGEKLSGLGEAMLEQVGDSPAFRDLVARKRMQMDGKSA